MDDTARGPAAATCAGRSPARDRPATAAPPQWHRGMTLIAAISLFIGARSQWTQAITSTHPPVAAVISVCYASILVCGVLALVVRGRVALARVDLAVLVTAITLVLCAYVLNHAGTDEGVLTAQAANEILHGRPIYGQPWPWLFGGPNVGITKTMSGGADYTYGYPPLTALLAAPVQAVFHSAAAATMVTTGALIAGSVALWILLPAPWRSAATAVCLGFGLLPGYARSGYPAIAALALLVPVVVHWPRTGSGGRLGRYGVLRAVCLGLACAAQQLAWFLAPFLIVGIYCVRRGELGHRRALAVVARYTGVAALSCLLVNTYFIVQDPRDWLSGMLLPITQGAILHGQGVMGISYYVTGGSSHLSFYSYGTLLLLLGLLTAMVVFIKRLGPAATVLPWCVFYLSTRSQDGYYLMMTPLWLAAAATVPVASFAGAWEPRIPRVRNRRTRSLLLAGLVAPALACVTVAAASTAPLHLDISAVRTIRSSGKITGLVLKVTNTTATALSPHFATRKTQSASNWWRIGSGPATLGPHRSAHYVVLPPGGAPYAPPGGKHPRMYLIAVTGSPMTISSVRLPLTAPGAR